MRDGQFSGRKRLAQIECGNEFIASIFADLNVRSEKIFVPRPEIDSLRQ
jgi:hypothetical protein